MNEHMREQKKNKTEKCNTKTSNVTLKPMLMLSQLLQVTEVISLPSELELNRAGPHNWNQEEAE